jgi:flagellar biosynthesis protein
MKKATAIKYNSETENAPKVIAKGKGYVADAILKRAKDANIPVYEDARLVEQLENLEIGTEIPPYLYDLVAQVLVFIAKMDQQNKL